MTGAEPVAGAARGEVETREPSKLERAVSRNVAESKATVPHLYAELEIELNDWTVALAGAGEGGPTWPDLVVWASARALRAAPRVNGAYRDGRFESYARVNVGVVVPIGEAFQVPTIADADGKDLRAIAAERAELAARARSGELTQPDLSGGTFSVSVAESGATALWPVVHRGQAAALGAGALTPRPVIRDGALAPGHAAAFVLAADHRLLSAAAAAEFLGALEEALRAPPSEAL